jgi:ADP-ribose pyrophosphatase
MREKTLNARTVYQGRIVHLELVEVELDNGVRTQREIIRHAGAAVVLPRLPDGRFLLVRQFRKPVEQDLLEMVAGTREDGEPAEACARRELAEEAGCTARSLRHLGAVYPSPGYVQERMDIFLAEVESGRSAPALDDDEALETVLLSRDEVCALIRDGKIVDAKTLAAWLLYEKIVEGTP